MMKEIAHCWFKEVVDVFGYSSATEGPFRRLGENKVLPRARETVEWNSKHIDLAAHYKGAEWVSNYNQ